MSYKTTLRPTSNIMNNITNIIIHNITNITNTKMSYRTTLRPFSNIMNNNTNITNKRNGHGQDQNDVIIFIACFFSILVCIAIIGTCAKRNKA